MSNGMLPTLTAETVRSWLLRVDKSRGSSDDHDVAVLDRLDLEATKIIKKLEAGAGKPEELIKELCQLRKKRKQTKTAILLMLIAQMNILKTEGQRGKFQEAWEKTIDKLNKDIRDFGSKTAPLFTVHIGGFAYKDPFYKRITDTAADVLEGAKILVKKGDKPLSELGVKDKMDLLRIGFDTITRWISPPGVGNFGGFNKFYSESIKAIGNKLEEIEKLREDQYKDYWVTFEDVKFGDLIDQKELAALIKNRVGKIKGPVGNEKALQIVNEAAKIRLLKAYNDVAKKLMVRLTTGDEIGEEIDKKAPVSHCHQLRFRELCDSDLKETPQIYQDQGVENIIITTQKATLDERMRSNAEGREAFNKWLKDEKKRAKEIAEVIEEKLDVDTYCDKKPVREIEELRKEHKKHIPDLVDEAKQAKVICVEKQKLAQTARKEFNAASDKFKVIIDEMETRQRNALDQLKKKHMPKIDELEKVAEELKKSIEQTKKDAFWAIIGLEKKELSPLEDKYLDADKKYSTFSKKYDPLRAASQQADLEYTKLQLRSKQGEKIPEQELSTLKTKSDKLEREELQMRGTYNKLVDARIAALEKYNNKKAELESPKTKVQQDAEKQVKQKEEKANRLKEQIKNLQEKYNQGEKKLTKDQTKELGSTKDALRKKTEAKKKEYTKKTEAAKNVCEEADQKQKKVDGANERDRRIQSYRERAKARECVEQILNKQMRSLLRSLEFVTKSERDIHATLWSYRGLTNTNKNYANLPGENLKKKARGLYGKSFTLAKFIVEINNRENQRTNFKKSLPFETFFKPEPELDLTRRLAQKDGPQNLQQEHKDFCTAFGVLDKTGLPKLQLTRKHLTQELSQLQERLAACLEKLQTVEKELGRTEPELFKQWEDALREQGKTFVESIKTIKSQERNQKLEDAITSIEETFKGFKEVFKHFRPKIILKEPAKVKEGVTKWFKPDEPAILTPPIKPEDIIRVDEGLIQTPLTESRAPIGKQTDRAPEGKSTLPSAMEFISKLPGKIGNEIGKFLDKISTPGTSSIGKEGARSGRKIFGIESPFPRGSNSESIGCLGIVLVLCMLLCLGAYYGGKKIINATKDSPEGAEIAFQVTDTPSSPESEDSSEEPEQAVNVTDTPEAPDDEAALPDSEDFTDEFGDLSTDELIAEGIAHLKRSDDFYEEHDCENWIPESEQALEKCSAAAKRKSDDPLVYYCIGKANMGLAEIQEAIENFRKALWNGLEGEELTAVEEILDGYNSWSAIEPCKIGEIEFEACGQPTTELVANWEFIGICTNPHVIVWKFNNKTHCHHNIPADAHESIDGSMVFDDAGDNIKSGVWEVKVLDVGRNIGESTCNVP